jgi:hypothetical protein
MMPGTSNTLRLPTKAGPKDTEHTAARMSLPNKQEAPEQSSAAQPASRWTKEPRTPHPDSQVFLVQEPTIPKFGGKPLDITPLLWWGKVRVLMERGQQASFRPSQAMVQIHERLKDFNPERDFIAVAGGDTLAVVMVGAILVQLGHSYFFWLRFERTRLPDGTRDPSTGAYTPIYVPLSTEAAVRDIHGV